MCAAFGTFPFPCLHFIGLYSPHMMSPPSNLHWFLPCILHLSNVPPSKLHLLFLFFLHLQFLHLFTCILLSHFFCNCHVCLFLICIFQIHFFRIVSPFFQDVNILEQAQCDSTNIYIYIYIYIYISATCSTFSIYAFPWRTVLNIAKGSTCSGSHNVHQRSAVASSIFLWVVEFPSIILPALPPQVPPSACIWLPGLDSTNLAMRSATSVASARPESDNGGSSGCFSKSLLWTHALLKAQNWGKERHPWTVALGMLLETDTLQILQILDCMSHHISIDLWYLMAWQPNTTWYNQVQQPHATSCNITRKFKSRLK